MSAIQTRSNISYQRQSRSSGGGLDIAVNNAGGTLPGSSLSETSFDDWRRILDVHLHGVFLCMKAELRAMNGRGGRRRSIINIGSIASHIPIAPGVAAYCASKAGLLGLTKAAALEQATTGIRVNMVSPGFIETPLLAGLPPEQKKAFASLHPIGRLGHPDEIADAVVWLSQNQCDFLIGQNIIVDGGFGLR